MKVKVKQSIVDYYTDILCHSYEPGTGGRLAIGLTNGRLVVLGENDEDPKEMGLIAEAYLPGKAAILGLHWSTTGIYIGAKGLLLCVNPSEIHRRSDPLPFDKLDCLSNVYDVCSQKDVDTKIIGACDDSIIRAWDVSTHQEVCKLDDHRSSVEVCNANNEYLVSGSQDGKIYVYDAALRSKTVVISFDIGKQVVKGLDISENSTWVAAGFKGSPVIYNLRNVASLPTIEMAKPDKIYTVHFDRKNNLWWAGGGTCVYRSSNLTEVSAKLKSCYGNTSIHHVFSITSNDESISAAGSAPSVLFSKNADYWEDMIHLTAHHN